MYLAIIILPLLGSIVSGFFGRKVGVNGAQIIASICVVITTAFAISVFIEVAFNNISVNFLICRWLDLASMNILWEFNFDFLTVSMLIPVLIISSLVHIYSVGYMSHDPHNQRFFSYLSLFTFMMVILVTSNNFLSMFVGWEGVGICSYLLVNFWFTRIAANQSSVSALLTNRVGDCFLTIGMFIMLLSFGNIDYATVFSLAPFVSNNSVTIIGICLLIGAMAKSSQVGLHVWLPLAMEGPTPVSALIHAATMVTAGVYLLMRASPLIEYSNTVLLGCLWIGSITTVFSSVIGLFQQDIKKVIAYSTMSQLGMMVIAIGLSCYNLALFHLINHAFYKGLLFLGAGAVIHAVADNQDFRKYGGLISFLPLSYTVMFIASLSLVAFPFMTGFYSKDFILEACFARYTYVSITVFFTALVGAIFTTLYSVKILYFTFIASPNAPTTTYNKAHEGNIFMNLPLIILAMFSVYFGTLTKELYIGLGTHAFIDNSIYIHPLHEVYIYSEFAIAHFIKLLPFYLTVSTILFSTYLFEIVPKLLLQLKYIRVFYNIFAFLNLKFLLEYLYNRFITYFILNIGGQTTKVLDKGFVEKIGPYGLETSLTLLSRSLNTLNTGVVTTYGLYILVGFMLYISLPFLLKDSFVFFAIMIVGAFVLVKMSSKEKNNTVNNDIYIIPNNVTNSDFIDVVRGVIIFSAGAIVVSITAAGIKKWCAPSPKENQISALSNNEAVNGNTPSTDLNVSAKSNGVYDTLFNDSYYNPMTYLTTLGEFSLNNPKTTVLVLTCLAVSFGAVKFLICVRDDARVHRSKVLEIRNGTREEAFNPNHFRGERSFPLENPGTVTIQDERPVRNHDPNIVYTRDKDGNRCIGEEWKDIFELVDDKICVKKEASNEYEISDGMFRAYDEDGHIIIQHAEKDLYKQNDTPVELLWRQTPYRFRRINDETIQDSSGNELHHDRVLLDNFAGGGSVETTIGDQVLRVWLKWGDVRLIWTDSITTIRLCLGPEKMAVESTSEVELFIKNYISVSSFAWRSWSNITNYLSGLPWGGFSPVRTFFNIRLFTETNFLEGTEMSCDAITMLSIINMVGF